MKKAILLIFITIFSTHNALAMINFNITGSPYLKHLSVEDNMLAMQNQNKDFTFLYNNKNEVIYIKHKNLKSTFKVPFSTLKNSKFLTIIQPENTELTIEKFKTKLFSVNFGGRDCLQFYNAQDLQIGTSISSFFAIYKAFVYLTGQGQLANNCKNLNISTQLDSKLGFPLAIFYKEKQFKLNQMKNSEINMDKLLKENNINTKKAIKPSLELQQELMLSLLNPEQQDLAKKQINNKPINIKIKTIQNLLEGF